MPGTFGRSLPNAGKHDKAMGKAFENADNPRESRSNISNLANMKGDHSEVAHAVTSGNPHDESHLASFLPAQLKCLDKFLPSVLWEKGRTQEELFKAAGNAPTVAQNVITELGRMHTEGPSGLHFLAFLAGALLVVGSVMNVALNAIRLSPLHVFFSIMTFLFGVATLVIEQQRAVFPPYMRAWIEHYFLFLTLITGRGAFYVYVGSIHAALNWATSRYNTLVGLYVLFVGGTYIHTGYSVNAKLHQLQHSLQSSEVIKRAFQEADVNEPSYVLFVGGTYIHTGYSVNAKLHQLQHSLQSSEVIKRAFQEADVNEPFGSLDKEELVKVMAALGSTMTEKEADMALDMLDEDKSGTVELKEFLIFMERTDTGLF
eukprot:CAMPEP_0171984866 /NCGR_PEP_ID=MMETSP0993-20121228/274051_1 /TAXON_ID=483369 /ORGANISM="non described non described, Strain CCMP2098" /LENGTH=372 /DNA_ID=CAMNT_0012637705 /DNA_START=14 /DNA_END=1133 /DNA_ORIENTATION=-